jgi:hypothetical protein
MRERSRSRRLGSLAGLAFAVCLFAGVAMLEIPQGTNDQELAAWWADRGNQASAVVSMYLFVAAGLSFLVLLVTLRSRFLAAEGGSRELTELVFASGVVFVAMLFVAAAARGVIGFAALSPANDEPLPGPDTLRYLPQLGYTVTGTGGMLAAALTMAAASCLIVRTAVFGRWLAWVGALAAVAVLGATPALSAVFAIPALLVWAVATSVALWRGASANPASPRQ